MTDKSILPGLVLNYSIGIKMGERDKNKPQGDKIAFERKYGIHLSNSFACEIFYVDSCVALRDWVAGGVEGSLTTTEVPEGNVSMLSVTEVFPGCAS